MKSDIRAQVLQLLATLPLDTCMKILEGLGTEAAQRQLRVQTQVAYARKLLADGEPGALIVSRLMQKFGLGMTTAYARLKEVNCR